MSGRGWSVLLLSIALIAGSVFLWFRREGTPPQVQAPEAILLNAEGGSVTLVLDDEGSGLRSATVVLVHAQGEETLLAKEWPGSTVSGAVRRGQPLTLEIEIDVKRLPRSVENARLRIDVRDWSLAGGLSGNQTRLDIPVRIDRKPPRIAVSTGLTYVRRGGAGVVVYSLSEEVERDGVEVGDDFFPGHALEGSDRRVAFYAVAAEGPAQPEIRVVATDGAGNVGKARWAVVVNERVRPTANVTLPSSFLQDVVKGLATAEGIDTTDLEFAFNEINTKLRARNEATIREVLKDTAPKQLWEGSFQQLPNSKVTSKFAEKRTYFVSGKQVSKATHYGYDLASTRAAPILAANAGRVVYADDLGIYGNCVLIDHGLGVTSLYGHLSQIDVSPGDRVERGQSLGRSGATGLAGGDHLHFGILVGGTYVDPLEWWDPKWVASNVEQRLTPFRP